MFNLFRQKFIVGYNDGLAGVKEFSILSDAIAEAKDASTLMGNITVRDKRGTLIQSFD
jgi:hypothetical protein